MVAKAPRMRGAPPKALAWAKARLGRPSLDGEAGDERASVNG